MNNSITFSSDINKKLLNHLIRKDGQEDLCFALYNECKGNKRYTGIIDQILLPEEGERVVHGNVSFSPNYLERVLKIAEENKQGIAFLHSHPSKGWQNMSDDDIKAEKKISPIVFGSTDKPLIGLTVGLDGYWSGRVWTKIKNRKRKFKREWCETIRVAGNKLEISFNDNLLKSMINKKTHIQTISAWGEKMQKDLSRVKVGIVGLGSVGSIVAEILARTGFSNFTLIDFDRVEEKNLDRLANVFKKDIGKFKVDVIKKAVKKSSSLKKLSVNTSKYSICEEEGFRSALDCDVLFSCVDRPWAREVLNFISYAYLIPVIDGGIKVMTIEDNTRMVNAFWKVHTVGNLRPCLFCLKQYSTEMASLEREGKLDDSQYIEGIDENLKLERGENVYSFSANLASLEVFQLLSLFNISHQENSVFNFKAGYLGENVDKLCGPNCYFPTIIAKGDAAKLDVNFCGKHFAAEVQRI